MTTHAVRNQLSLLELAKRTTDDGNLIAIAEVLDETNDVLLDAPWQPSNQTQSHLITRRNSLPSGTWRKINEGIAATASSTTQVVEPIGLLEAYSKVDKVLVDIAANPAEFRAMEDRAFIEGLSQDLADAIIYGNAGSHPERFNGLAVRLNDLSQSNVFDAGGSGSDVTSLYIVQWGVGRVYMVYPRNDAALGLMARDLGEDTVLDASNNEYQAYRTHFSVKPGLAVVDERSIIRIANVETSGSTNIFDDDTLIEALNNLPYNGVGAVVYCNRTIKTQMDIRAKDKSNVNYSPAEVWGRPVMTFRGVPVRRVDAILDTETAVT